MSLIFSVIFLTYGGLIFRGRDYVYEYVAEECDKPTGIFGDFDRLHTIAEFFACTDQCPCDADVADFTGDAYTNMTTSPIGMNNITDCEPYNQYMETEGINFDNTLHLVEQYF